MLIASSRKSRDRSTRESACVQSAWTHFQKCLTAKFLEEHLESQRCLPIHGPAVQTPQFSKHALDFFSLLDSDTKSVMLSQSPLMERCTAGATSSDEAANFGYVTLQSGGSNNCSHPRGMIEHASSHSFEDSDRSSAICRLCRTRCFLQTCEFTATKMTDIPTPPKKRTLYIARGKYFEK